MLANGENVSSKFHENEIAQHPWVDAALVFGHARWQCGLLVDLHRGHQFDSSDPIKLAHARAEIWPRIEAANSEQPGYAKIFVSTRLVFVACFTMRQVLTTCSSFSAR